MQNNSASPIKIALFEDNADLREGLRFLLDNTPNLTVVGAWPNCEDITQNLQTNLPDIILMDIEMPKVNGIEGLKIVKQLYPNVHVLMLTVFEENDHVFSAICNGASGYILKRTPPAKIVEAINETIQEGAAITPSIARNVMQFFSEQRRTVTDKYNLTQREKETLASLVKGNSYKMIAAELGISVDTVRSHIKRTYEKLQVCSQTEAVAMAIKERIV
ncbi:MAG: response regulator [Saprospiraceae bacterium]